MVSGILLAVLFSALPIGVIAVDAMSELSESHYLITHGGFRGGTHRQQFSQSNSEGVPS